MTTLCYSGAVIVSIVSCCGIWSECYALCYPRGLTGTRNNGALKNLGMDGTETAVTSTSKHGSGGAFRIDIKALSALSVLAVVGYHYRVFGFAGGFVGVDIW